MGVVHATTVYPPIGGKPSTVRVPIGRCPGRVDSVEKVLVIFGE